MTIPPKTTANIVIPADEGMTLCLNDDDVTASPGVVILDRNERKIILQVTPGTYSFVTER